MLGLVFIDDQESNNAEHYLKRSQKIMQEQGNTKIVKEIKTKLSSLKESKDKKMGIVRPQT